MDNDQIEDLCNEGYPVYVSMTVTVGTSSTTITSPVTSSTKITP